jgi:RES domain-containing protein
MRAYRLVKARHAALSFTGEGARLYGGRWNRAGTPMVYAAQSLSLAALETFVHFAGEERGIGFASFAIDIPDECVEALAPRELPGDWRAEAPPASTQDVGTRWQRQGRSVALAVPSVIVPSEACVLLNPAHPDTRRVVVHYPDAFAFDGRLLRRQASP